MQPLKTAWTRWNQHIAPIETYFDQEYTVINHDDIFFYYVLGEAAGYSYPTYERINQQFQLTTFANDQKVDNLSHTKGIAISVWTDIPEAKKANEVVKDLFWLQATLNEKVYAFAGERMIIAHYLNIGLKKKTPRVRFAEFFVHN